MKSRVQIVVDHDLHDVHSRVSFFTYVRAIRSWKSFSVAYGRALAFSGYENLTFGRAWIVLNPLLQAVIYGFIFGWVLNTSRGVPYFIAHLLIGIFFFGFFSTAATEATTALRKSRGMIESFAINRAAIVLSLRLAQAVDNLPVVILALFLGYLTSGFNGLGLTFLLLPLVALSYELFLTGVAFFFASWGEQFPDMKIFVKTITRIMFYLSGIFFSVEVVAPNSWISSMMSLNPVYQYLTMLRELVIFGQWPSTGSILLVLSWSFLFPFLALVYFWANEARYGRN